ncbi:MAG: methionyl-tRNA formyltransferase [Chloroflexi bacterium]|nr:methionyl-tRNA formyltransferase [Chloroflexota bacterium]|tara:strand:+ start:6076 stop:7053 length:978 start_codon:yes stop_codon:yes gene_type:complete
MKTKIIFFASDEFGADALEALNVEKKYQIEAIISPTIKRQGRNRKIIESQIDAFAIKNNIEIFRPKSIDPAFIELLAKKEADIGIVVSSGYLIPDDLINIFPHKIINVHPSLLPKYRGPSPIQASLLNGDLISGITIMEITNHLDGGPILAQLPLKISALDNAITLKERLIPLATKLLLKTLANLINNQITQEKQNERQASYTKKIEKNDGKINWSQNAKTINNQIRAYAGWPNAYTKYKDKRLTILSAYPVNLDTSNQYKKIGSVCIGNNRTYNIENHEEKIFASVRCNNSELIITEIQLENKRRMPIKDFINGNENFLTSYLG